MQNVICSPRICYTPDCIVIYTTCSCLQLHQLGTQAFVSTTTLVRCTGFYINKVVKEILFIFVLHAYTTNFQHCLANNEHANLYIKRGVISLLSSMFQCMTPCNDWVMCQSIYMQFYLLSIPLVKHSMMSSDQIILNTVTIHLHCTFQSTCLLVTFLFCR